MQARLLDSELRHVTQTVGSGITNVIEVDEMLDLFVHLAQPGSTLQPSRTPSLPPSSATGPIIPQLHQRAGPRDPRCSRLCQAVTIRSCFFRLQDPNAPNPFSESKHTPSALVMAGYDASEVTGLEDVVPLDTVDLLVGTAEALARLLYVTWIRRPGPAGMFKAARSVGSTPGRGASRAADPSRSRSRVPTPFSACRHGRRHAAQCTSAAAWATARLAVAALLRVADPAVSAVRVVSDLWAGSTAARHSLRTALAGLYGAAAGAYQ